MFQREIFLFDCVFQSVLKLTFVHKRINVKRWKFKVKDKNSQSVPVPLEKIKSGPCKEALRLQDSISCPLKKINKNILFQYFYLFKEYLIMLTTSIIVIIIIIIIIITNGLVIFECNINSDFASSTAIPGDG